MPYPRLLFSADLRQNMPNVCQTRGINASGPRRFAGHRLGQPRGFIGFAQSNNALKRPKRAQSNLASLAYPKVTFKIAKPRLLRQQTYFRNQTSPSSLMVQADLLSVKGPPNKTINGLVARMHALQASK